MANQNFGVVHSLFLHMTNQSHENLEKWPTISNFLFCTLCIYIVLICPKLKPEVSVAWYRHNYRYSAGFHFWVCCSAHDTEPVEL